MRTKFLKHIGLFIHITNEQKDKKDMQIVL